VTGIRDLVRDWDGAFVVARHDRETGADIFIAVHTTGPEAAAGGTRARHYGDPAAALADAQRLALGMSLKLALLDLPRGGGKAVLDVPEKLDPGARDELLGRYGDLVDSLRGAYQTGPDLGTGTREMDRIAEHTRHVFGTSPERGGAGDSGPTTALGVLAGIGASLRHRFGSDDLAGRRVLVQGLGGVGRPLAEMLAEGGAEVLFTDVDPEVRDAHEGRGRFRWVAPEAALETECDVLAPCAVGGVLGREEIARLGCAVVAGSANNPLREPEDAGRLRERGILYAPDFVITGGGAIHLIGVEALGWSREKIAAAARAIGDRLAEIYRQADEEGLTTQEAAMRLARTRLAARRGRS